MSVFSKKQYRTTKFSEFIRHASSAEKKRVYKEVLEKATERQRKLIESYEANLNNH